MSSSMALGSLLVGSGCVSSGSPSASSSPSASASGSVSASASASPSASASAVPSWASESRAFSSPASAISKSSSTVVGFASIDSRTSIASPGMADDDDDNGDDDDDDWVRWAGLGFFLGSGREPPLLGRERNVGMADEKSSAKWNRAQSWLGAHCIQVANGGLWQRREV
ncbi:hypothetical protein VTK73DRAFT_2068 [Phialemonium thermophilum]|uniref:Secreted protein n=1 Tax=Phialemonium thermophilum TaxID=223376 RepID=A0ABR3VSL6_9PEZI